MHVNLTKVQGLPLPRKHETQAGFIKIKTMSERIPFRVNPMLAALVPNPFDRPCWVYEEKYDGYRILAYKEGAKVTLYSRNAKDRTHSFADVAAAIVTLPDRTVLLDGEGVACEQKL